MDGQEITALIIVAAAALLLGRHLAGKRKHPAGKDCDRCQCGENSAGPVPPPTDHHPRRL